MSLLAIVLGVTGSNPAKAQEDVIDHEYQIKAAYLYNFGKYVDWPSSYVIQERTNPVFVIGVVGQDPFDDSLRRIAERKKLKGMAIIIRNIRSAAEYQPCHVLFFSKGANTALIEAVRNRVREAPVLTVGETDGYEHGDMIINLFLRDNNVRFKINPDAANRVRLKISAKLLRIG